MNDWNPASYGRFAGLRLRPALDLLAHVPDLPAGAVVDLGCGNGAVAAALAERWRDRERIGVDASPAMLAEAEEGGFYSRLTCEDIADWVPDAPPALIFSNAALHWLPDHPALFARLAASLAPGGVLAVQMPRQYGAPSHRFLRDFATEMFPDRFDHANWRAPVATPVEYLRLLAEMGQANVWETEYIQRLGPSPDGHPVRRFTESTAMRPYLAKLTETEAAGFVARYEGALAAAYPLEADGGVLFPFRRLFITLVI